MSRFSSLACLHCGVEMRRTHRRGRPRARCDLCRPHPKVRHTWCVRCGLHFKVRPARGRAPIYCTDTCRLGYPPRPKSTFCAWCGCAIALQQKAGRARIYCTGRHKQLARNEASREHRWRERQARRRARKL